MTLGATWQVTKTTLINMAHQFICQSSDPLVISVYYKLMSLWKLLFARNKSISASIFSILQDVLCEESWMLLAVGSLHSISKLIGVFLHHNFSSNIDQEAGRGFKCVDGAMAEEAVGLLRGFYGQGNPNGKHNSHEINNAKIMVFCWSISSQPWHSALD